MRAFGRLSLALGVLVTGGHVSAQRVADLGRRHDFGRVRQGETIEHTFTVANTGSAAAQIARVEFDTPGVTARFRPLVPAGGSTTVRVIWDTSRVDGDATAEGTVIWATAGRPPLPLTLHANVVATIEVLPLPAVFFSLFTDEPGEQTVEIVNHDPSPVQLTAAETPGAHFSASVEAIEPGRRYRVRVRVPAGAAPGRYRERADIRTDLPARPVVPIGVNVLIKADVYANPEAVDFGAVDLAALRRSPRALELLSQTVLVKRRQGPFRITAVACDVPAVLVKAGTASSATQTVEITFAPDRAAPGPFDGHIVLTTSDPRVPQVRIPVRGQVR